MPRWKLPTGHLERETRAADLALPTNTRGVGVQHRRGWGHRTEEARWACDPSPLLQADLGEHSPGTVLGLAPDPLPRFCSPMADRTHEPRFSLLRSAAFWNTHCDL